MGLYKLKYLVSAVFLAVNFYSSFAQVKITDGAVLTLNLNSLLELESTNKGLLIPHMAIKNLSLPTPLTAPVPIGMQVYDTSYLTPNGFYYWTGTNWKSFSNPAVPVVKSANATLLKTETVVLASGNNTVLTLPTVTSADSGLQISVKNVGTYTDLITVVPQAGKVIDASTSSQLTRWKGKTYLAVGSNWIVKEKETREDNLFEVSASGSFITIAEVIAFLNAHISAPSIIQLGAGTYSIAATQTINLSYPVTILGLSYGETMVAATAGVSGSPLFICQTECYFKMIKFSAYSNAAGNDAIHFTGASKYHEVKDCDFSGFNKGLQLTNNCSVWFFENTFENCAAAAIEIAAGSASGGALEMANSDFTGCAIGVNLLSSVAETLSISNCNFYNAVAGICLLYAPATYTSFVTMFFVNNTWNNLGTFISGFDFTRTDGRDANVFIENNAGMQNEDANCKINVVNNPTPTPCPTANAWYKALWTNTSSYTTKFTIVNNNITYQPANSRDLIIFISGNVAVRFNNSNITVGIVKNGVITTQYGATTLRITTANQAFQFSTVIYLPAVVKNDYFEFYCTSTNNNDVCTFQDMNWFANAQ